MNKKMEELSKLKNKTVQISASSRMNRYFPFVANGNYFRVVGVFEATDEIMLESKIPQFVDDLTLLPVAFYGIEWDIEEILG